MPREGRWDVFVSHSSVDKPAARRLRDALETHGFTAFLDEAEINPGDSILERLEDGLAGSTYTVVLLTPASVRSRWVREELRPALMRQISNGDVRILPLLLEDCEVPLFLTDRKYIDFRNSQEEGIEHLVRFLESDQTARRLRRDAAGIAAMMIRHRAHPSPETAAEYASMDVEDLLAISKAALLGLRVALHHGSTAGDGYYLLSEAYWQAPLETIREVAEVFSNVDRDYPPTFPFEELDTRRTDGCLG